MTGERLDGRICRGLNTIDAEHVISQWTTSGSLRKRLCAVILSDIEASRKKSDSRDVLGSDIAVNLAFEVGRRDAFREAIRLLGLTDCDLVV